MTKAKTETKAKTRKGTLKSLLFAGIAISSMQTSAWAAGGWFSGADQNDLQKDRVNLDLKIASVHQAFLENRFQDMAVQIKDVLSNEEVRATDKENVLSLINKAYTDGIRSIPTNWQLPHGMQEMRVGLRRKESPDGVKFHLNVKMNLDSEVQVKDFKLTQYPNTIIFDKSAGIGEWEDYAEKSGHQTEVRNKNTRLPLENGLYLVDITLNNDTQTQGWFILSDELASASPVVTFPAVGDHFTTPTPTFRWQNFRSPEYKPSETSILGVYVGHDLGNDWKDAWEFYEAHSNRTDITVGANGGNGETTLTPGQYYLGIIYRERHEFGPISLQRESATYVPFTIDHQ